MREGGALACLSFSFPASLEALEAARKRAVEGIGEAGEKSERWLFEWKLVVSEALSNAVEHGSPGGVADKVTVKVLAEAKGVWLAVRQRGPVKERTDMLGLKGDLVKGDLAERGRGLSLIGRYSGEYYWRELGAGGAELRVWKPYGGEGKKAAK